MEQSDRPVVRNVVLALALGIVLSRFSIMSLLMTLPLLYACANFKEARKSALPFTGLLLVVSVWTFIESRGALPGLIVMGLYPPVCSIVGAMVWSSTRDESSSLLRRFFWACIPVFAMGMALSLYFSSSASLEVRNLLTESMVYVYESIMETLLTSNYDVQVLWDLISSVIDDRLRLLFAPIGIMVFGLPILICDSTLHKFDDTWQDDFAMMKAPDSYAYVLISSLALCLVSVFVELPKGISTIAWNTGLSLLLLYAVVGASILVYLARKKSPAIRATRIVITLILMLLIPFLNALVLLALPILGVLETWVAIRR